jgi:hypothetical protein
MLDNQDTSLLYQIATTRKKNQKRKKKDITSSAQDWLVSRSSWIEAIDEGCPTPSIEE